MDWLVKLRQAKLIGVIRHQTQNQALATARAIAAGGIKFLEITWNTAGAAELTSQLRQELPQCLIGAGTVLNSTMAKQAIASGAQYLFTPHVQAEIIQLGLKAEVPIVSGAMTPTEIITAWDLGASAVKVFPIKCLGGAKYLECLQPVIPHIPLIPTGGINLSNGLELIHAGAIALGISSALNRDDPKAQAIAWVKLINSLP
ncbi:MAG: bifunctional 4-hydroxy-2-oxoglutarate aldolase/2-dehydro-3-deoxy-phosphogluconate aldolase [Pseudanabaenaceae cyanobacterium bins.68]|nr:bifunctional 4-hydroxy-2-oxoglutarate aldolase/2-dehydro-3-deoxy-phosphogluconate aldolase [Pseudanabaenaceae cyanobacterium bins.68]